MLKERDINIIKHIERYGFITIKQGYKIFFNKAGYGYDLSRKKLANLEQKGYISGFLDYFSNTGEKIYYIEDKFKNPSKHTVLVMDTFSEIVKLGAEVLFFKREQKWLDGERRSDAYSVFKIGDYLYELFIEVEGSGSHKRYTRENIIADFNKKYTEIIQSKEPQLIINDIFGSKTDISSTRRILVVDNIPHVLEWLVDDEIIVQVNSSLEGIGKLLI